MIFDIDCLLVLKCEEILCCVCGYVLLKEFFVEKLVEGVVIIVVVFYLNLVIVCFFDFKLNEYCKLFGGELYELEEENLMFGFCGVLCYIV